MPIKLPVILTTLTAMEWRLGERNKRKAEGGEKRKRDRDIGLSRGSQHAV